jgi:hypothetical protein
MIRPRRRISIGLETARQEADEEEMQRKQDIVGLVVEHVWGGGVAGWRRTCLACSVVSKESSFHS